MSHLAAVPNLPFCAVHGDTEIAVDTRGFKRCNACHRERRQARLAYPVRPGPHAAYRTTSGRWVIKDLHAGKVVSYPLLIARLLSPDAAVCLVCGKTGRWGEGKMPFHAIVVADVPSFEPDAVRICCHWCAEQVRKDRQR